MKVGVGLAVWCSALVLSLFMRLLGSPGLTNRVLPSMAIIVLPFLVVYALVYRLRVYPALLDASRRMDARQVYQPVSGGPRAKAKRSAGARKVEAARIPAIEMMPGKATAGLFGGAVIYYVLMLAPTGTEYHDLHELGMLVAAPLGYLIGLAVGLGDGARSGAYWLAKTRR